MTIEKFLDLDSQKMYVNIIGEGEEIVFLHGGPGSDHRVFLPDILPLSNKYKLGVI